MKQIDARGLACPAPVLQTKAAIDQDKLSAVKVLVDNEAARQNVVRFLSSQGFETSVDRQNNDENTFVITGTSTSASPAPQCQCEPENASDRKIMVMCATDRIGFGDEQLGLKLMTSFIKTLKEMGPELWRLVFVNNGVKLTIEESEVLPDLQSYEKDGLKILVCGTCLTYFNLLDKKKVGETTNMLDIVTAMQLADKVINI